MCGEGRQRENCQPHQSSQLLSHHSWLYISSLRSFSSSVYHCLLRVYPALPVILCGEFTQRLVKGPVCLHVWIRFTWGLGPCLVLFALTGGVRAREGISYKTLVVKGYLRGLGKSLQDISLFYLCINLFFPLKSKPSKRKFTVSP